MKTFKMITLTLAFFGLTTVSANAADATATASATIITPISIVKATNLSFGNIAAGTAAGTVVMAPAGTRTVTGTNGPTLPASTGTVSAATFNITGLVGMTFSITLPASAITLSNGTPANDMTLNTFTSTPTVAAGGTLTGGTALLSVGGTLSVGANQAAGTYNSTSDLTVTVNYN